MYFWNAPCAGVPGTLCHNYLYYTFWNSRASLLSDHKYINHKKKADLQRSQPEGFSFFLFMHYTILFVTFGILIVCQYTAYWESMSFPLVVYSSGSWVWKNRAERVLMFFDIWRWRKTLGIIMDSQEKKYMDHQINQARIFIQSTHNQSVSNNHGT